MAFDRFERVRSSQSKRRRLVRIVQETGRTEDHPWLTSQSPPPASPRTPELILLQPQSGRRNLSCGATCTWCPSARNFRVSATNDDEHPNPRTNTSLDAACSPRRREPRRDSRSCTHTHEGQGWRCEWKLGYIRSAYLQFRTIEADLTRFGLPFCL